MSDELKPHRSGDWWRGLTVPSVEINGEPMDLTGAVATFQVKDIRTGSILLDLSSDAVTPGITITAPTGPISVLGLINTLPQGQHQAGLKVWPATGKPRTILVAKWTILPPAVQRDNPS